MNGDLLLLCATKVTYKPQKLIKLPFPIKPEDQLAKFIKEMLKNIKYPSTPNTDRNYNAGFRLEYNYVGKLLIKPV